MSNVDLNLGDLVNMVGVELRIAQILADQAFREIKQPAMASGHYTVMALLSLNPGINQSAIAKSMHLKRSSMVPILDQLEDKGWIERRTKSTDRRSHAVHLTTKGSKNFELVDLQVRALEADITAKMGRKNREQLLRLLQQFQDVFLDHNSTDTVRS